MPHLIAIHPDRSRRAARVALAAAALTVMLTAAAWASPVAASDAGSRICFGAGEVNAALFKNADGGFDLYGINGDDEGVLLASWNGEELAALDEATLDENQLLHADDDYGIALYKLTSGEFQVNAGPDGYGKTYVCTFEGLAPADTTDTVMDIYAVEAE